MAQGFGGGTSDWLPPPRRDLRGDRAGPPPPPRQPAPAPADPRRATGGGGRRRAPEPPNTYEGFSERKPPRGLPPEPPGARNGMLARPRGVSEPPPPRAPRIPPEGRRRAAPTAMPPTGLPPRNSRPYERHMPQAAPPISPAPRGLRPAPQRPARPGPLPPTPGPRRAAMPPPTRPRPVPESTPHWRRAHINPALSKRWRAGLSALGVLVVLAVCGFGSYLIVRDEQRGVQAQANDSSAPPTAIAMDISSREVDPEPLTTTEVFPKETITIDPNRPDEVYTIIAKPQELKDCRPATKGEVTTLFSGLGCSQVIRATMRSPSNFLVTGGIFNLDTLKSAETAWESIRDLVAEQKGGFVGYAPPGDKVTKPLVLAATQVGWNIKGHYLAYCVIARSDGEEISQGDPFANQIMYDIVEIYLKGTILEARAVKPVGGTPTPLPSVVPSVITPSG